MVWIDVLNYALSCIMMGVACAWVHLIRCMAESFARTPYLDDVGKTDGRSPRVSVIVPARNEEEFIASCLDSLACQDYENYEVVAINDSSEDRTLEIIKGFAKKDPRIITVDAKPKPEGWMGKNWACMEGFRRATGELLLFTDADTKHQPNTVSLAVSHLASYDLDALSVIPKMLSMDWWTRVTLPMISTFLHTWFSALKVNDPAKKTGYFFGSFFIIKKNAYMQVGMHEGVREEIIEDGALGGKVKQAGFKVRMVRGEHLVEAVWARDRGTLWNALKRLMVPMYAQNSRIAVGIFFAVLFLLFAPFPLLAYSAVLVPAAGASGMMLFFSSLLASALIYAGGLLEAVKGLYLRPVYAAFAPLGSLVVVSGFLSGLLQAKSDRAVSWRGRSYSMRNHTQNSINI